MKRFLAAVFSLLALGFVSAAAAVALAPTVPTIATHIILFAIVLIGGSRFKPFAPLGDLMADIAVEVWVDYIIQRLRKDNLFMARMYNDDQYVYKGRLVHIPQPGAKKNVVKNRGSLPAVAVKRTDTDIVYVLDEYTTDPGLIPNSAEAELSYDQMNDVMGDDVDSLSEVTGDDLLIKLATLLPFANVLRTSGASSALALEDGQTGTRKVLMPADLKAGQARMNKMNVPKTDRVALLESNRLDELTSALDVNQQRVMADTYDAANGILGRLYGFDIMERSSVVMAADAANGSSQLVVNPLGAATGATDQVGCLLWQKNCVARALGEIKPFQDLDNPLFYGDLHSFLVRMGGRRRRADNAGVIALLQATGN